MNAIAPNPVPYCEDSKLETFQNLLDLQKVNAWFLRVIGPAAWSSTGTKRLERAVAPGRDEGRTGDGGTGMKGPGFGMGRGGFVGNGGKNPPPKKNLCNRSQFHVLQTKKDSTLSLPEYLGIIPPRVVSLGDEHVDKVNPVNRLEFASSIWSQLIYDWWIGHKVIIEGTTKQYSDVLCMPVMHGKWYESEYVYDINMNMHINKNSKFLNLSSFNSQVIPCGSSRIPAMWPSIFLGGVASIIFNHRRP